MNIVDLRRKNLRTYITQQINANLFSNDSDFCDKHDLNPSQISQIMRGHGAFGERAARNIERKIGLDIGFLDSENIDTISSNNNLPTRITFEDEVDIPFYEDFPLSCGTGLMIEALQTDAVRIQIKRSVLNRYNVSPIDVAAFPSVGDSMAPVIRDKAIVYVDTSKKNIVDGKIYAICHGGLFKFKYLYNLPLKGVRVVSENSDEYPEDRISAEDIKNQQFEIIGYAFYVENGLP